MDQENKVINYLLIFSIFLYLLSFVLHPITAITQDLGRHLKVGEIILETGSVPKTNLLTYTYPDFSFINHHWLSEVVFFVTFQAGNFGLLLFCKILLIFLSFGLIFCLACKKSSLLTTALFSFIFLAVFQERTELRPEVLSFLFFAAYLFIINESQLNILRFPLSLRAQASSSSRPSEGRAHGGIFRRFLCFARNDKKRDCFVVNTPRNDKEPQTTRNDKGISLLWLLPLIQLLWVNSHIYFFVGPAIYLFFVIDQLVKKKLKISKTIIFVGLLIIMANFVNPNGLTGAFYPLKVFENYGYQIVENKSPFFLEQYFGVTSRAILFFKISLGLLIISFIINLRKINYFNLLIGVFLSFMAVKAIRNFPLFALGTLPIVCQNYEELIKKVLTKLNAYFSTGSKNKAQSLKIKKLNLQVYLKIVLIIFYLWQASIFISNSWCRNNNSNKCFSWGIIDGPQKAGDFIIDNKISGPMFNNFDVGSFLEYRVWPKKTFIDGRPEAFPQDFFSEVYIPMQEKPEIWDEISLKYDFNYIFFSHTDQTPWAQVFLKNISQNKEWIMVYLNDWVVVYLKNNDINQEIINKFGLNSKNVILKTFPQGNNYLYFLRLSKFLDLIGWQEASQLSFQKSQILKKQ